MRRALLVLIALCLSLTTIGYACAMEGEVVRSTCCCQDDVEQRCAAPTNGCDMAAGDVDGCCTLIAASDASNQSKESAPATQSLLFVPSRAEWPLARIPSPTSLWAPARAHDCSRSSVYLLTGRLRR